jgi:predicted nucleic acid-binding protein
LLTGRAVLDTNVVLDWLVFRNPRADALDAALSAGSLQWLSCPAMRSELAHMLASERLARWAPDASAVLARHDGLATLCEAPTPSQARLRCSDPDDQVFVDLALAQRVDWLWTHDRALLKLARRAALHGLRILAPAAPRAQRTPTAP